MILWFMILCHISESCRVRHNATPLAEVVPTSAELRAAIRAEIAKLLGTGWSGPFGQPRLAILTHICRFPPPHQPRSSTAQQSPAVWQILNTNPDSSFEFCR